MMTSLLLCSSLLLVVGLASSASTGAVGQSNDAVIFGFGPCPAVPVSQNFNLNQLNGTWYEQKRFPFPYGNDLTCVRLEFAVTDDPDSLSVTMHGMKQGSWNPVKHGFVRVPKHDEQAKMEISIGDHPYIMFWAVDIVEDDHLFIWSCLQPIESAGVHQVNGWIMTRWQHPVDAEAKLVMLEDDYKSMIPEQNRHTNMQDRVQHKH